MQRTGRVAVDVTRYDQLIFSWAATPYPARGCTTLSWALQLAAADYGRISSQYGAAWSVTIDGQSFSGLNDVSVGNNQVKTLAQGQADIAHSGEKDFQFRFSQQFYIRFAGEYIETVSGSGSGSLDALLVATVPRPGVAFGELGSGIPIFTEGMAGVSHTLSYRFGGETGIIGENIQHSCTWTPPLELARQIPNALAGSAEICCESFLDGASIGTATAVLTLGVPETLLPGAHLSWTESTGLGLLKDLSRLTVTVEASGAYGSTVTGAALTLNGRPYTGGVLTQAGENLLSCTVTDSRGRQSVTEATLEVLDYHRPRLELRASRCTADGTPDDTGEYAHITAGGEICQAVPGNTGELTVSYGIRTVKAEGLAFDRIIAADSGSVLDITAKVTDSLCATEKTMTLSTGYATLDLLAGGRGIAFGTTATREGFECAMNAVFTGGVRFPGPVSTSCVRTGNTVTVATTLEGGRESVAVITLENEVPVALEVCGQLCPVSWEGFDA